MLLLKRPTTWNLHSSSLRLRPPQSRPRMMPKCKSLALSHAVCSRQLTQSTSRKMQIVLWLVLSQRHIWVLTKRCTLRDSRPTFRCSQRTRFETGLKTGWAVFLQDSRGASQGAYRILDGQERSHSTGTAHACSPDHDVAASRIVHQAGMCLVVPTDWSRRLAPSETVLPRLWRTYLSTITLWQRKDSTSTSEYTAGC